MGSAESYESSLFSGLSGLYNIVNIFFRIIRAFLIEEQKIVVKVLKAQQAAEKAAAAPAVGGKKKKKKAAA